MQACTFPFFLCLRASKSLFWSRTKVLCRKPQTLASKNGGSFSLSSTTCSSMGILTKLRGYSVFASTHDKAAVFIVFPRPPLLDLCLASQVHIFFGVSESSASCLLWQPILSAFSFLFLPKLYELTLPLVTAFISAGIQQLSIITVSVDFCSAPSKVCCGDSCRLRGDSALIFLLAQNLQNQIQALQVAHNFLLKMQIGLCKERISVNIGNNFENVGNPKAVEPVSMHSLTALFFGYGTQISSNVKQQLLKPGFTLSTVHETASNLVSTHQDFAETFQMLVWLNEWCLLRSLLFIHELVPMQC